MCLNSKRSLKETNQTHYHIVSVVLKELVDRDLGFITMLILKNSSVVLAVKYQLSLESSFSKCSISKYF